MLLSQAVKAQKKIISFRSKQTGRICYKPKEETIYKKWSVIISLKLKESINKVRCAEYFLESKPRGTRTLNNERSKWNKFMHWNIKINLGCQLLFKLKVSHCLKNLLKNQNRHFCRL